MKMNKKYLALAVVSLILLISVSIWSYNKVISNNSKKGMYTNSKLKETSISSIDFNDDKKNITLIYPSQDTEAYSTEIVKIDYKGSVIEKKEINDPNFSSITLSQKPNQPKLLYAFQNGDVYSNHFYTFDFKKKKFSKKEISYFKYDVMLDSVSHYGDDIWFRTATSYKTGTQKFVENKGFSKTFSNFNSHEKLETPPGFEPVNSPVISLKNNIVYVNVGSDSEDYEKSGMVFLNKSTGKIKVFRKKEEPYAYATLYGEGDNAYFASTDGWMIRINEKGEKIEKPFSILNNAYYDLSEPMRMINKKNGLQVLTYPSENEDEADRQTLVKWSFDQNFNVQKLKPLFWKDDRWYKYLFFNPSNKKSYFVEFNPKKSNKGKLIIADSKLNVIQSIPIDAPVGLDFVID